MVKVNGYTDITEHIGGLFCACYDCRTRKGNYVREAVPVETEIRMYEPNRKLEYPELRFRDYQLDMQKVSVSECQFEYILVRG